MTADEILAAVQSLNLYLDSVGIDDGEVRFCDTFSVDYEIGEEPHDAAFDHACFIRESVEPLGLTVLDWESDNDSVWGKIGERPMIGKPPLTDAAPLMRMDAEGRVILTGVAEEDAATVHELIRLAVAEEREACAKVADEHWDRHSRDCATHEGACFREIAAAIRARRNRQ